MITQDEALAAYKKYGSKRAASHALGIPRSTFRRALAKAEPVLFPVEKPQGTQHIEKSFQKDSGVITTKSLNIKTLEDALAISDVDLSTWDVDRYTINSWEVTMKGLDGVAETVTNYQVKVWLAKKLPEEQEVIFTSLVDRLVNSNITLPLFSFKGNKEVLVVPGLVDHHFGLLAWHRETKDGDYDLNIAEELYVNAMQKGIDAMKGYDISQFLIPVGSDLFHINNPNNLTPKGGNHLDVDSRLAKVFETGLYSVIKAIDLARQIAPVEVKWVPGNHDPETSFYLCKVIAAYYRNDPNVSVDVSPQWRKFYKWNNTLIGMCHGDEEPHQKLPTIMADSVPDWWAACSHKEWLVGHIHKKKEMNFIGVDSFGATIIRFLPSLCKIDHWHYKKGYVGGNKSMEILAYGDAGLKAYFPIYQDALV